MIECRRGSLQGLVVDGSCWEALRLCVGIVSLADYKTQVWRFWAG